jgi:FkbM family methyltransferase
MLIDFRQLFPKYGIKPTGVLHVGANVGEEAPVYLELGIKRQIWIEANPDLMRRLSLNLIDNPEAIALNWCVSDKQEEVIFHVSNNGSQSSSILELGTHLIAHPEVNYVKEIKMTALPIWQIFLAHGYSNPYSQPFITKEERDKLDFLNIDLQGAELKALKGMGDLLHQFKWAYLEVNKEELYKGCALVEDIDFYLSSFGFKRVETKWCGNTGWGDALYIK